MKTLYVGNLAWQCTEDDLSEFFAQFGTVQSAKIITDRDTGRSRGFGFVDMEDGDAETAISQGNGQNMGGRPLRVNEAQPREPRPRRF